MGMDVGAKGGVRSDINITPLVDVVLVLLIIFMVITPMLQRGKSVELPKARHATPARRSRSPLHQRGPRRKRLHRAGQAAGREGG